MIIPCMNCTSAGEAGGSLTLVDDGRVRVGLPGAPGWTTTGAAGDCCAQTRKRDKPAKVLADATTHAPAAMANTTRIPNLHLTERGFKRSKYLNIVGLTLSYLVGTSHSLEDLIAEQRIKGSLVARRPANLEVIFGFNRDDRPL